MSMEKKEDEMFVQRVEDYMMKKGLEDQGW